MRKRLELSFVIINRKLFLSELIFNKYSCVMNAIKLVLILKGYLKIHENLKEFIMLYVILLNTVPQNLSTCVMHEMMGWFN